MFIDFVYRKPKVLEEISKEAITQIAIHHTAAENTIKQDTDYQIDDSPYGFVWLGYGYYIDLDGSINKVRGIKYKNAGVLGQNHRFNLCNVCYFH